MVVKTALALALALALGACGDEEPDSIRQTFCQSTRDVLGTGGARGELEDAIKVLEMENSPERCAMYRQAIRGAKLVVFGFMRATLAFNRPYVAKVFDALWNKRPNYWTSLLEELDTLEHECDRLVEIPAAKRRELVTAVQTVLARLDAAMATCPWP
jgi:hypothetical protein